MTTIIAIISGMIIWQAICMIAIFISDENEAVICYVSMGIFVPICFFIGYVIKSIRLIISRQYNRYAVYGDGNKYLDPKASYLTTVYMTKKTASYFRDVKKYGYQYAIELKQEGKDFKNYLYRSEIMKKGDKFDEGMNEEYFKKFLERG